MKPLAAALLAALAALAGPVPAATSQTLLLVGDSTLAPRTGYGNVLCQRLESALTAAQTALACHNLARGGRSTHSYRAEGLWDEVLARLRMAPSGTVHVLIQFGHNDQPGKPGRSTDLATEFPTNLARYVDDVRAAGGVPLLATPLTRRSFRDGQLHNDLQDWADATRRVAADRGVPLLDLNRSSAALVRALGQAGADELAMAPPPPPGQAASGASGASTGFDRTHLGAKGACVFAALMAQELAHRVPAFAQAGHQGDDCARVLAPAPAPAPAAAQPLALPPP